MRKELTVMILGAWIALVPYLGFPRSWDEPMLVISGLLLVLVGFLLRHHALERLKRQSRRSDSFAENTPAHDREYSGESSHDSV
jgi:hypothetical protein